MRFILLRGLGRDQLHWQPLLASLRELLPEANIETPDIPGSGVLCNEVSPTHIADYLPFLEQQLNESNEPAVLVGLSLGGMIALKWAEQKPQLFSQLVLVNTSSRLNYFFQRLKLHQVICYPEVLFSNSLKTRENAIYRLTCNNRPVNPHIIEEWTCIQQKHPVKTTNQIRQLLAALRFKLPPRTALPPVHILYSVADRLVSSQCSEKLIEYYQATYDKHVWAGHDIPQDDPHWVATRLFKCVEQTSAANKISA